MSNIKSRLESLEAQAGRGTDVVKVVLLTFLGGKPEPRAVVRCGGPEWRLDRNPGESVQDFYARAELEAPRTSPNELVMLGCVP